MKKYPASIIVLHWLTVLLIAWVAFMGFGLEDYEFNAENFSRFRNHALMGMLILIITLIRLFLLRKHKDRLPQLNYYSNFHKFTVNAVHTLMYLLLIFIPIAGFINVYQTGAFGFCFGKPFPEGAQLSETLHEIHEN
jgi:cytochrome b561